MIRQFPKSTKRTFNSMDDETIAEEFNEDFHRLFVSIGQCHCRQNPLSPANECDLTLNANYFVPRLHLLSEQFPLNTVESKQIESLVRGRQLPTSLPGMVKFLFALSKTASHQLSQQTSP